MAGGSTKTILIALGANVGIAVAKFGAAAVTGSSAMLTEGIHSLVDSTNQLLLLYGRKQSRKAPDATHPFGYGRELYFWSFIVAILVFSLGAGVSVYEGILHIIAPEHATSPLIAFIVLGVAAALEGWSTVAALADFNKTRRGSIWAEIRKTKDAPTLVLLLENSGALIGLAFAAAGLTLSLVTGNPFWDGLASVLIGLVLGGLAVILLYEAKGLLIGESADPAMVEAIRSRAAAHAGVVRVHEVLTLHSAPTMVTVIISADFEDAITARDVERVVLAIEREVATTFPIVARVYVRPRDSSTT
ncbi:cation diffusion facilitator family transporter [Novosphingobium sp. KCTC 2891]|uniref:cation diffusion facilitator family transporter n=1 Tax=Novosphingobium sp. KCTC 2891 TaxID=2989730 RepID=UPI0022231709|nr:cation diffusion facilitator family transporter [Novosphingobium sp. KCTC 2891]MCW1383866.1 cation diffusion facilitator family transporter [Novosphingobium sp. KCTC 2891]